VKACKQAVRQLLVVKPISNMVNKTKRRAHHLMCVLRDLRQEMRFHDGWVRRLLGFGAAYGVGVKACHKMQNLTLQQSNYAFRYSRIKYYGVPSER
jgi:hypothetical protein